MQRSRDALEKQTFTLTEELRAVKTKVESQSIELSSTINDLKLRSRRLEEENKMQVGDWRYYKRQLKKVLLIIEGVKRRKTSVP